MRLHLVRHGPPAVDPTSPASTWPLDPSGFVEIDLLLAAGVLPANEAVWFSSTEPKAVQTAARLTSSRVPALDELREADRPADWLDAETFAAAVATSLERPAEVVRDGWETSDSVRARVFGALRGAVGRHAASEGAVDVVLVGHGTAWTVLVAALTRTPPDVAAWRRLHMPDHCVLDLELEQDDAWSTPRPAAGRVARPWGSWRLLS
jgi:broad specificity phosphatase PhoE